MLFHAFRIVYTGKEFDSHAQAWTKFQKKIWTYNRVFLCQKSHFRIRTSFGEFFSIVVLYDVNDGGTPYMGISPGKNTSVHASTRVRTRARPSTRFNRQAGSTVLARENVSKEVCFWL